MAENLRDGKSRFAKTIYEYCGDELGDLLSLDGVTADRNTGGFTAFFIADRVLDKRELRLLEHAISSINGMKIKLSLSYKQQTVTDGDIKDGVLLKLQKSRPLAAIALERCIWKREGGLLTITDGGERFIDDNAAVLSRDIAETAASLFDIRLTVRFLTDESIVRPEAPECTVTDGHSEPLPEPQSAEECPPQESEKTTEAPFPPAPEETKKKQKRRNPNCIFGMEIKEKLSPMNELNEISGRAACEGTLLSTETKTTKKGDKVIFKFAITDYTSSVMCKMFPKAEVAEEIEQELKDSPTVRVFGDYSYDTYDKEYALFVKSIMRGQAPPPKEDNAPVKRVELHLHTRLSEMDSVVNPAELVKLMKAYGHDTVAITDHGVVQAYPELEQAIAKQKAKIKLLFGLEGYLYDDEIALLSMPGETLLSNIDFCVFDLETTGIDPQGDRITEIGAVKICGGEYKDRFSTFVNPHREISEKIRRLTGINNSMVADAPDADIAVRNFLKFAQGCVLVAHNASFDTSFIRYAANVYGMEYSFASLDTLELSRLLLPGLKSHKLDKICTELNVLLDGHHRAVNDAEATAGVLIKLLKMLDDKGITTVDELNAFGAGGASMDTFHIIIFARDKKGLSNLYKLVTESHLHHFHRRPRIPRSLLRSHREGLILGSACEQGELFKAVVNHDKPEKLEAIASFYDFLEVQPIGNNRFMIEAGRARDEAELMEFNKTIVQLGERINKPVVATGDVHFLLKRDECFRRIIMAGQGFADADKQAPLYYRTTQEMLDEFSYLPDDKAREIVIENPRKIADMCESMESFPRDRLYTPKMDGAEEEISDMATRRAHEIYGEVLPEIVEKRLNKELDAIIKHGFAVLYLIAHKVVGKSLSDGYLVGSRGSVGSSFVATMTDITEVNPLPPHYICPSCKYSDFNVDTETYGSGFDLPHMNCPKCGTELNRAGFDIPFEVFMGFKGDKCPDIDLNFSGEYQPNVHKYIEELFGKENVFRAGTIAGVAEKTAFGYVLKYCEERQLHYSGAEKQRLAAGIIDVKRTTGQHPGGIVVLPKECDIYDFTPLQYPSNDESKGVITTHFDFNSLHDTLLKLDILGHDDPTAIRMLERLTGLNARKIPLDDPKVMSLFLSPEALNITAEELGCPVGTYGIPEFGTNFVQQMLVETKPVSFADLVRISGLSHGTDVWSNNAQLLVQDGTAKLPELICTREDIMNKLIAKGAHNDIAFKTMETVRKGRPMSPEMEQAMVDVKMPQWFIDSCHKIKYMFPKAHAAAYVTMALRIAYFKVYYPVAYYMTFFTVRADDFDISLMQGGVESLRAQITEYKAKSNLNPREKGILAMLELGLEMRLRGISFANIDIYKSEPAEFTAEGENVIRPPLNSLPGMGLSAAKSIAEARINGPFTSQEDLLYRTKISKTVLELLLNNGCLKGMPQSEQIMLFELD